MTFLQQRIAAGDGDEHHALLFRWLTGSKHDGLLTEQQRQGVSYGFDSLVRALDMRALFPRQTKRPGQLSKEFQCIFANVLHLLPCMGQVRVLLYAPLFVANSRKCRSLQDLCLLHITDCLTPFDVIVLRTRVADMMQPEQGELTVPATRAFSEMCAACGTTPADVTGGDKSTQLFVYQSYERFKGAQVQDGACRAWMVKLKTNNCRPQTAVLVRDQDTLTLCRLTDNKTAFPNLTMRHVHQLFSPTLDDFEQLSLI